MEIPKQGTLDIKRASPNPDRGSRLDFKSVLLREIYYKNLLLWARSPLSALAPGKEARQGEPSGLITISDLFALRSYQSCPAQSNQSLFMAAEALWTGGGAVGPDRTTQSDLWVWVGCVTVTRGSSCCDWSWFCGADTLSFISALWNSKMKNIVFLFEKKCERGRGHPHVSPCWS